jgi:hypothetical protein
VRDIEERVSFLHNTRKAAALGMGATFIAMTLVQVTSNLRIIRAVIVAERGVM